MNTIDNSVNPHLLGHITDPDAGHKVEAGEDIVTANGIKLLAKGSRIDASTCERLLEYKLQKPLENCVRVVDGVDAAQLAETADKLINQHGLLRSICADGRQPAVGTALASLKLTPQLQTLLTVYVQQQPGRLEHTVGVALMALALARRLLPGESEQQRALATAGLLHDVGELYIDPALFDRQQPLGPLQWRHIATHPIVGHRVLLGVAGGGKLMAEAVRDHHERLDGFGYPRGVQGAALSMPGQLLAASEWLMAMMESGLTPVSRVSTATKLIQGEFSPPVVELVHRLAKGHDEVLSGTTEGDSGVDEAAQRLAQLVRTLGNFRASRPWLDERIAAARGPMRQIIEGMVQRLLRIQTAFISTGLAGEAPQDQLREMAAAGDLGLWLEVAAIVHELGWRLREIERTSLLRAGLLSAADLQAMQAVVDRLNASEPVPALV